MRTRSDTARRCGLGPSTPRSMRTPCPNAGAASTASSRVSRFMGAPLERVGARQSNRRAGVIASCRRATRGGGQLRSIELIVRARFADRARRTSPRVAGGGARSIEAARAQRSTWRVPWIVHSGPEEKIPLGLDCFSGGGRARNDGEDCSFARQVELAGFLTHRVPPRGGTHRVRVPCSGRACGSRMAARACELHSSPRPCAQATFHGRAPPSVAHQLAAVGVTACAITGAGGEVQSAALYSWYMSALGVSSPGVQGVLASHSERRIIGKADVKPPAQAIGIASAFFSPRRKTSIWACAAPDARDRLVAERSGAKARSPEPRPGRIPERRRRTMVARRRTAGIAALARAGARELLFAAG